MTYKQIQKRIGKLADEIDDVLGDLESKGKDTSNNYHAMLYLAGGLRDLADMGFDDWGIK